MPYNDMGDKTNITEADFEKAGTTEAIDKAGLLKAKQNMYELLKKELEHHELEHPKKQY